MYAIPEWAGQKLEDRELLRARLLKTRGKIVLPKFKEISEFNQKIAATLHPWAHSYVTTQKTVNLEHLQQDFGIAIDAVFGKGTIKRVLFPAVYLGRVARAISEDFEVTCVDIENKWVDNARSMGMEAFLRSAEDFPEGKFDLVVCFEPYPLYDQPSGYLFALRAMSQTMGFVNIREAPVPSMDTLRASRISPMNHILLYGSLTSIFSSYGCFDEVFTRDLEYQVHQASGEARRNAALDLKVIRELEGSSGLISATALAGTIEEPVEEVDMAISRIRNVINKVYFREWMLKTFNSDSSPSDLPAPGSFLIRVTGSWSNLGPKDPSLLHASAPDFMREIEITD